MKPKTPKPTAQPLGPLQERIIKVLMKGEASASEILLILNKEKGAKLTTLASVRDALYRGLMKKGLVAKLPVAFTLVGEGKK